MLKDSLIFHPVTKVQRKRTFLSRDRVAFCDFPLYPVASINILVIITTILPPTYIHFLSEGDEKLVIELEGPNVNN